MIIRTNVAPALRHDHALGWTAVASVAMGPGPAMRYTRPSSVFSDARLSPSFLRTTPAKNPRTECGCQPVISVMLAIVAPFGRRSSARTRARLESSRVRL